MVVSFTNERNGMSDTITFHNVLDILEKAPRLGSDKDEPEGTRYIIISDTLAKKMIAALEAYEADQEVERRISGLEKQDSRA